MISSIKLQNFRLYKNSSFEFDKAVNIIVGPNTCGKTSLLEAILVITSGGSFRARDADLVGFNKNYATIEAEADGHNRIVKITKDGLASKTLYIDGKEYKRISPEQIIQTVLFEPNDLLILTGAPDGRRNYLDTLLSSSVSGYKKLLNKYNRALHQRNTLLKSISVNDGEKLFPWNIRLSQLGGQIVEQRLSVITKLSKNFPKTYAKLSSSKLKTNIEYISKIDPGNYETKYLRMLEDNLHEDHRLGFTRYGPHRDDFLLTFNNHPAEVYASRGELRSATLVLKIMEHELIRQETGKDPLFLLDDVFSELDSQRRHALAEYLKDHQSFITTTDADIALKQFNKHRKILPLGSSGRGRGSRVI